MYKYFICKIWDQLTLFFKSVFEIPSDFFIKGRSIMLNGKALNGFFYLGLGFV